ncbi:MAG TPA: hypothetical protein VFN49_05915 [Candidatus Aquilonibacter sp.]|nr:hypothetical protein [Candidatus Aquilonibacter sp.]
MKRCSPFLALLLALATTSASVAQPRVIGDLTQGALLGEIRDTAQLQRDFSEQHELLAQASQKLGLSRSDFSEVRADITAGRARYVQIPRRLDGMAGQYHGRAFAVHNIVIPPHVYGWEVDLERPNGIVRVFMPNRCGNMSYLRVPRKQILAAAMPYHLSTPAPAAAPTPASAPAIAAAPTPLPQFTEAPQPVALAPVAPVATTAAHHFALLPWLALGLIGIALLHGHGGGISTGPPAPAPAVPTPAPVHTICPTAVVVHP